MTTQATARRGAPKAAPAGHCRWCLEPIDKQKHPRARTWHPKCVQEWEEEQPQVQRRIVWQRDRGVCQCCGLNLADLESRLRGQRYWRTIMRLGYIPGRVARSMHRTGTDQAAGFYWFDVDHHLPSRYWTPGFSWASDHVVPLWKGGANRPDNLQVLCDPCHKAKTSREAGERAAMRRAEKAKQTSLDLQCVDS